VFATAAVTVALTSGPITKAINAHRQLAHRIERIFIHRQDLLSNVERRHCQRQLEPEFRSLARRGRDTDAAAVQVNQTFANIETQTSTTAL
jgi:hypothetical protein